MTVKVSIRQYLICLVVFAAKLPAVSRAEIDFFQTPAEQKRSITKESSAATRGTKIAKILFFIAPGCSTCPEEAAKLAGLPVDLLKYDVPIETAKGRGRAASVTLDRLAVGNIVERRVPALVSEPGDLRTSLLGMSFLNRLESFEVRGSRLVLRAKGAR